MHLTEPGETFCAPGLGLADIDAQTLDGRRPDSGWPMTEVPMNVTTPSSTPARLWTAVGLRSVAVGSLLALFGCTTQSQTFEGYSDDQVWSAMVAAARAPEYDEWKIAENETFIDEDGRRVEVYRVLRRLYVTPYSTPLDESREWRMQMVLGRDDDADAPVVDFTARQITVPAHVWAEAERYFNQVRSLLGPASLPQPATTDADSNERGVTDGSSNEPLSPSSTPDSVETPEVVDLPDER